MRAGLCTFGTAVAAAGSPPVAITPSSVRIHAPWNAQLDVAARETGRLPYEARDRGAALVAELDRALRELSTMRDPMSSTNRAAVLQIGRIRMAGQGLWAALQASAPALAQPGGAWAIEPVSGGLRISEPGSATTIALVGQASKVSADAPQLAAAIALLPALMESGVAGAVEQHAAVLGNAWLAYEWANGRGAFPPQDANVLWVNADAAAELAGARSAGGQAGPCPVASTVRLASGAELWVRADAASAQLTLVSLDGDDLHAERLFAACLVGSVHTIQHEGLRADLVVAEGRPNADGRTAVPLREALAGGPAAGGLYNNALGMITVGDAGGRARVRAVVAGLSQPLVDETIAVEDLGAALGPMVLRRFQQRQGAGVPASMVLAAHEVALMRGHLAEAIDAAGAPAISAAVHASAPVVSSSAAGM